MKTESVQKRLQNYGAFDAEVVDAVAAAAVSQGAYSFGELASLYDIGDGPSRVFPLGAKKPLDMIHISARVRCGADLQDPTRARVLFSPFGVDASPSMAMRAIRLYAADPSEQLIVVGNPSIPGRGVGKVALESLSEMWRGDLRPMVEPTLAYLNESGVTDVTFLGYSGGGDLSAAAAKHALTYDVETENAVIAESAGMHRRWPTSLAGLFLLSGTQMKKYVQAAESPQLLEARSRAGGNLALYAAGLLRATNLAMARAISRGGLSAHLSTALADQPNMRATIAYGSVSELVDTLDVRKQIRDLQTDYPGRVGALPVYGMHHAGGDDINLHAAIMLQGMASARR